MKIMYIGKYPEWYKHSFGGEEHIQKLAELMSRMKHEVYLINSVYEGVKSDIYFKKLNYVQVPFTQWVEGKPFPLYPKIDKLKEVINEIEPEVIHHFAKQVSEDYYYMLRNLAGIRCTK